MLQRPMTCLCSRLIPNKRPVQWETYRWNPHESMLVALKWRSWRLAMYIRRLWNKRELSEKYLGIAGPSESTVLPSVIWSRNVPALCWPNYSICCCLSSVTLRLGKQTRPLISKAGKNTLDKNWSPINVSLMISRIFSSLLDHRLRNIIEQFERQKGFTNENGCYNNIQLINKTMVAAKTSGGIVLDISKACLILCRTKQFR